MPGYRLYLRVESRGSQCNSNFEKIIKSDSMPTEEFLREIGILRKIKCEYIGIPDCETCPGSEILLEKIELIEKKE